MVVLCIYHPAGRALTSDWAMNIFMKVLYENIFTVVLYENKLYS